MQTIKDRFNLFLKYKGFGQARFAELAGLSKGFINSVTDNVTTKSLTMIQSAFPELDIDWLLTGNGQMLKEESTTNDASELTNENEFIAHLKSQLQELKEENNALKENNDALVKENNRLFAENGYFRGLLETHDVKYKQTGS